jgi:hypothetical protein
LSHLLPIARPLELGRRNVADRLKQASGKEPATAGTSSLGRKEIERASTLLMFETSPGFREKLAERVESIPVSRALFHKGLSKALNIRTNKSTPR